MSFLNPWLLAGIAGIAAPIIIHLLARKQVKRVVWAAMRFLKVMVDRNQRRMTLEDILLLALRCLVIALVALALARPALRSAGFAGLGSSETAIVLIDQSGSMSTTDGAVSRFEKAKKAAEQVVDAMPSGSAVAVWFVSDVVRDSIPEPARDLALARKVIRESRRSDQATEWIPAIRKALEVMERQAGASKQLYLITDAQASGWKSAADARNLLESVKQDVQARLIHVGEGEQGNVAVTQLRLASSLAPVRQPLRFEVDVTNFGLEEMRDVSVSLAVNDDAPSEEQVIPVLPANAEPKTVSLFATIPDAGVHTVTARVRPDRCPFDDARTFAIKVIGEIDVLLVDGDPGSEPRESEVFYLRNALTPVPPELLGQYFIKTRTISAAELERTPLRDFEAVVLANVVDFSPAAAGALTAYVRAGGGLMVFPGTRISQTFYNEQLHTALRLLPAAFGGPRGEELDESKAERPQNYFTLQAKGYDHRIALPWRDPKNGTLATAQFYRAFSLIPAAIGSVAGDVGPAAIVLSFGDGAPALVERTFGYGRVLQFASTADAGWTDLPVRPAFVPLMHRCLGYLLARQEERLNIRVGTPFQHPVSPELIGRSVAVVEPGGMLESARSRKLELYAQAAIFRHEATSLAGAYQVRFPDQLDANFRFAAQADPAESSIRELTAGDLNLLSEVAPVVRWAPGVDLRGVIRQERTGTEFWLPILLSVLGLIAVETFLGNRWSRSR